MSTARNRRASSVIMMAQLVENSVSYRSRDPCESFKGIILINGNKIKFNI